MLQQYTIIKRVLDQPLESVTPELGQHDARCLTNIPTMRIWVVRAGSGDGGA